MTVEKHSRAQTLGEVSGSQQKGRMRFGCVHHGKPRDTRKIDDPEIGAASWIMPWPTVHAASAPAVSLAFPPLHDQYSNNGRDLLLKALQDLELLQTELGNTEEAENMARQVHISAKELQQEFAPIREEGTSQPIPREFAPAGPASTLPQRKAKGKAKGRTLTGMEMAERNSRKKGLRSNHAREPTPTPAVETQEYIHEQPIHVISSTAPARC
ncbi:hypothetical protein L211DRAFT_849640 [Terfezia boudieri ATCC MYA-4762]|uniref:Uncharacterized protein n=1 Tax=Terfezia boudieri ATCC MYA-4762 TaxID=1051890 RepID=A0A3N4LL49_9PEZI|nr:hypothetical protein L211DRAFT_849640 [Terfezia boudieri ATCC MYA-4762]